MIRIATFNIQYCSEKRWSLKRAALIQRISEWKADVVCLQEVSRRGVESMQEAFGPIPHVAAGRDDGEQKGEHLPVWVFNPEIRMVQKGVFWFSPTPEVPSVGWGGAYPRICTWCELRTPGEPERPFYVFNVHLDHWSRLARLNSAALLKERIRALPRRSGVVVLGDFNIRENSPTYRFLVGSEGEEDSQRLRDAWHALQAEGKTPVAEKTWDGWGRFRLGKSRLDYLFLNRHLEIKKYTVGSNRELALRLSDHRPVVVELDWIPD